MPQLTNQADMAASPLAARRCQKNITFTGAAGLGAVGAAPLFTVTGAVLFRLVPVVTEDLTEAGATATISIGTAASPAAIVAAVNAVDLDTGEVWIDNSPAPYESWAVVMANLIGDGADIIATIGAQAVNGGSLTIACFWTPISQDGYVIPA